ncbi:hypothetical protein KR51_00018100 [Rubidibacter lacunae KORDI 51-2]|uniref:Uncharacterized protein n=1 Tax=Rubidibacter lacunae KORDI 51-2 TaxID=582515 RepID=U5DIV2_9CHRO|nr:hypothetical protein KR51_00018100 [Rubidibacter lacunae KORDI 51-2]
MLTTGVRSRATPARLRIRVEFPVAGLNLAIFCQNVEPQPEFANSRGSGLSPCLDVPDLEAGIARPGCLGDSVPNEPLDCAVLCIRGCKLVRCTQHPRELGQGGGVFAIFGREPATARRRAAGRAPTRHRLGRIGRRRRGLVGIKTVARREYIPRLCSERLEVQRTAYAHSPSVEDVGVNHRGFDIFVTEEFLDRADVVAGLQQVGGKAVA